MKHQTKAFVLGLAFILLAACSEDEPGIGQMSLQLAETLVDPASEVATAVVEFSGVELRQRRATPQRFLFDAPREIDLLHLTGGDSTILLDAVTLPAGRYDQLRLLIYTGDSASAPSVTHHDGSRHPLFIPRSNLAGLNLNTSFTVPEDEHARFAIDFELRQSVTNPKGLEGAYILRPTLRQLGAAPVSSSSATAEHQP